MTSKEQVTDFKLEGATVRALLNAVNEYLKRCGIEPEDRGFSVHSALEDYRTRDTALLPDQRIYRWLIAFAIEGDSEGYYIHIGAMMRRPSDGMYEATGSIAGVFRLIPPENGTMFMDFGHAKCYTAEQAYQIATEAQRFLTAAAWN